MACSPELVTAPLELYWAPSGTAFPLVNAAPTPTFTLIGTGGSLNYTEDGIGISSEVTTEDVNSLGDIDPRCIVVTGRDMRVSVTLMDHTLDQIRLAFNNNAVTQDPGPPSVSILSLDTGSDLTQIALLARGVGKSPEFVGGNFQWEFDPVVEVAAKELAYVKGQPAAVNLEFRVLAGIGAVRRLVAQDA